MFIEVIINGVIENRIQVKADLPLTGFTDKEFKQRERLVNAYLVELKKLYPKACFQLAYESRVHEINI